MCGYHIQLLRELTRHGGGDSLGFVNLSTGKFPKPAMLLMCRPLTQQQRAFPVDDGGYHTDACLRWRMRR